MALSIDRGGAERVDPFFEQHGIARLKRYLDPRNTIGSAMNIRILPTTVLIDAQGREIGRLEGPAEWDAPEILALLRDQLSGGDSGGLPPPK